MLQDEENISIIWCFWAHGSHTNNPVILIKSQCCVRGVETDYSSFIVDYKLFQLVAKYEII